jgi:hypothetical protein
MPLLSSTSHGNISYHLHSQSAGYISHRIKAGFSVMEDIAFTMIRKVAQASILQSSLLSAATYTTKPCSTNVLNPINDKLKILAKNKFVLDNQSYTEYSAIASPATSYSRVFRTLDWLLDTW